MTAALSSDDSITFDVDTGADTHYIPTREAHKLDNYSTSQTGHTVVCANNIEDPTRGCGSIQGKLSKVYTMDNFQRALLSVPTLIKRNGRTGNEKTPNELLHNKKPNLSYPRALGCTAYVHQSGELRPKKHSPRAR